MLLFFLSDLFWSFLPLLDSGMVERDRDDMQQRAMGRTQTQHLSYVDSELTGTPVWLLLTSQNQSKILKF